MIQFAKRYTALFAVLALALSVVLAACGPAQPEEEAADPTAEEEAAAPTEAPAEEEEMEEEPTEEPTEEMMEEEPTEEPTAEEPAEEEAAPGETEEGAGELLSLPAVAPADLSGDIAAAGSSTVFPLAQRIAEEFEAEGYTGQLTIDSIGSGAGFERFCVETESDISNASRPIRAEEVQTCVDNGREPIEFLIGIDALAVTVSTENDFVEDVTIEELAAIFATAETWADVRPDWPAEPILRYSPGTDSGTFDYFVEEVFEENEEPLLNASNVQLSENDNVLVQGVEASPYAVGYFGYAYYEEEEDRLTALSINGVEPSGESVEAGEYPLARPLFMYTTASIMNEKPQVSGFLNYVLNNVNDLIGDVGYFPASTDSLNTSIQKWSASVEDGTAEALGLDPAELPEVTIDAITVSEGATSGDAAE
jgi:phosphate transport system substrate-binding protein